jgi:hypothetical protein
MDASYRWELTPPQEFDVESRFQHGISSFIMVNQTNDVTKLYQKWTSSMTVFENYYPWINEKPRFEQKSHNFLNKNGDSRTINYIYGELVTDNEIFDESLLLQLLWEFSQVAECFIHLWNSTENEVLLVHSFDAADSWLLDRMMSMNRTWIHNGLVAVLNNHTETTPNDREEEKFLPLHRAIAQIRNNLYTINDAMTKQLHTKVNVKYNLPHIYDISIKIPEKSYKTVCSNPWLIGKAIAVTKNQDLDFINTSENDDPIKVVPIHAVRLAEVFIQLMKYDNTKPQEIASKMLSVGLDHILSKDIKLQHKDTKEISRDKLQQELIHSGNITTTIPQQFDDFAEAFNPDGLDEKEQEVLVNEFSSFMENKETVEKIINQTDIVEEDSEESDDVSCTKAALDEFDESEFADFVAFCVENGVDLNQTYKRPFEQIERYNDSSDYFSDSDMDDMRYLQTDHDDYESYGYVGDKVDVLDDDDDELISPYDSNDELQAEIDQFVRSKQR